MAHGRVQVEDYRDKFIHGASLSGSPAGLGPPFWEVLVVMVVSRPSHTGAPPSSSAEGTTTGTMIFGTVVLVVV